MRLMFLLRVHITEPCLSVHLSRYSYSTVLHSWKSWSSVYFQCSFETTSVLPLIGNHKDRYHNRSESLKLMYLIVQKNRKQCLLFWDVKVFGYKSKYAYMFMMTSLMRMCKRSREILTFNMQSYEVLSSRENNRTVQVGCSGSVPHLSKFGRFAVWNINPATSFPAWKLLWFFAGSPGMWRGS
jgi:hypothetical protein